MDPDEIEFIAEFQTISIIPSFSNESVIHLISGDIGPFRAGYPQTVPLWLAVYLKQRRKCQIIPPDWMDVELLQEKKEEEKNSRYFTKMPSNHYMEIANILFDVSSEDIVNCDSIRTAIKDLWDIRIAKLRSSVDMFIKTGGRHAQLNYLTQLEINSIRPLLPDALNALQDLSAPKPRNRQSEVTAQMANLMVMLQNYSIQTGNNTTIGHGNDSSITGTTINSTFGRQSSDSPSTSGLQNMTSPSTSGLQSMTSPSTSGHQNMTSPSTSRSHDV